MDRGGVVVTGHERVGRGRPRDAGAGRRAERQGARPRLHEERVRVTVVAPFELEDAVAAGGCAGHSDGAHRGFGAGADEAHALDRRHQRADTLGKLDLERAGRAEAGAVPGRRGQRFHERARGVAVNQGTPRHHVVDERVAVDVLDAGARRAADEQGRCADGLERPNGTVDTARQQRLRACEEAGGANCFHG